MVVIDIDLFVSDWASIKSRLRKRLGVLRWRDVRLGRLQLEKAGSKTPLVNKQK